MVTANKEPISALVITASVLIAIAGFLLPAFLLFPLFMFDLENASIASVGMLIVLFQIILSVCGAGLGIAVGVVRNKKIVFIMLFSALGLYFLALAGRVAVSFFIVEIRTAIIVFTMIEALPLILVAILLLYAFIDYIKIKRRPPQYTPVYYNPNVVMYTPNSPVPQNIPPQQIGVTGQNMQWQGQGWQQQNQHYYNNQPKDTAFGVTSLILGVISLIIGCFPFVGLIGVLPIVFGILAIKKNNKMGIAGLILGIIALAFATFMTAFFVIDVYVMGN